MKKLLVLLSMLASVEAFAATDAEKLCALRIQYKIVTNCADNPSLNKKMFDRCLQNGIEENHSTNAAKCKMDPNKFLTTLREAING